MSLTLLSHLTDDDEMVDNDAGADAIGGGEQNFLYRPAMFASNYVILDLITLVLLH